MARRVGVDSRPWWKRGTSPHTPLFAFAAAAIGSGLWLGLAAWPEEPTLATGFAALMLGAIVHATFDLPWSGTEDWAVMPLSFVIDFSALLLFGPHAMTIIATAGAIAQVLANSPRSVLSRRVLLHIATVAVAAQVAGLAYVSAGGTTGDFIWPWQSVPLAAAIVVYCFVSSVSVDVVAPLLTGKAVSRAWPRGVFRSLSTYVIGAAVAVAVVEILHHRAWEILPAAAVPLLFAYRSYSASMDRLEAEHRQRAVIESLDQGVSVVDLKGRVTLWNDALARMLGCPREKAVGRLHGDAVPSLARTALGPAVADALSGRSPKTSPQSELVVAVGARTLQVSILPIADGVTLFWHDVTERTRADHALRQEAERLALTAEGANDGLWAWDVKTHEFYVSARWRELVGLVPSAGPGRLEDWFDRVHPDDVVPLKDVLDAQLAGRTDHFEHEHRIRHEDGTYRWFLCRGVATRDIDLGRGRIAGSLTDIADQVASREQIRSSGSCDPLTGLSNRTVFVERLGKALDHFKTHHRGRFAVLYLDLDRFKVVNDSLGHLVGDDLLIAVSRRLESCLRPADALARLGGDEFAILLNGLGDDMQANVIAFRIQDALSAPFSIGGREVFTSASIGIAFSQFEYANPEEIMRDADTAMYHAKAQGKARHELFDADMHARARDRLGLENDLRHAVKNRALEVYYQPIVSLETWMCTGFESLVRWKRNGEPVSPADFIPVAEELGLIESLGSWVLQEACRTFADWKRRFPAAELDCITVNVSARQLLHHGFVRLVEQVVEKTGTKPRDLRLEITETALMGSPRDAADVIRGLREFGVKIYLDDFGTGYSSLSHLHKLPVDALKVDRSFVRSLLLSDRPAIVESILALARTLGTGVVAEGVESDLQAEELKRLGCRHAQGFFFSPPRPAEAIEQMLAAHAPLGRKRVQRPQGNWLTEEPVAPGPTARDLEDSSAGSGGRYSSGSSLPGAAIGRPSPL